MSQLRDVLTLQGRSRRNASTQLALIRSDRAAAAEALRLLAQRGAPSASGAAAASPDRVPAGCAGRGRSCSS
jgi:hypothetical protein